MCTCLVDVSRYGVTRIKRDSKGGTQKTNQIPAQKSAKKNIQLTNLWFLPDVNYISVLNDSAQ